MRQRVQTSPAIPPGGFAIITPTTSTFEIWPEIPEATIKIALGKRIGNGLANENDFLILKNQNGEIVDSVCWGREEDCEKDGFNYACPKGSDGDSLEKKPFYLKQNSWFCSFFVQKNPNPGKSDLENYWHREIIDPEDATTPGYEITFAQMVYGEDEILNFLPLSLPTLCKTLIAKLELKEILNKENYSFITENGKDFDGYGGVGMKVEAGNKIYLFAFDLSNSNFSDQYLFVSEDNGQSWNLLATSTDYYFIFRLENEIYFALNTEKFPPLPWKISFLSGFIFEDFSEHRIFDQTEEILLSETENQLPRPIINYSPKNPVKRVEVKFDASSSIDPDGQIIKFEWQIKNTSTSEILFTSTATTASYTFPENGIYEITLTATDNDGATSSTSTILKVEPFSFAIITDLHIGRGYENYEGEDYYLTQRLESVAKWINVNKDNIRCENTFCPIKFLAILGDITNNTSISGFCKAKEILDKLEIPYIPVFGNHDVGPDEEYEKEKRWKGQDYFDQVFWSTSSIPCQNATSPKNFEILLREFNFQRDEQNKDYKNFSFSYGGINFIGLDFVSREKIMKGVIGYGVASSAVLNEINRQWLEKKLEEFKGNPVILLAHHPLIFDPITSFSSREIIEFEKIFDEKIIFSHQAGHVHSFEEFHGKLSPSNANIKYPKLIHYTPNNIFSFTTEALMVGSNGRGTENETEENGVRNGKKGIIRIVKIFDSQNTNPNNWEVTETTDEFLAFNPKINFGFSLKQHLGFPCVEVKTGYFTTKPFTIFWDFGDGTTSTDKEYTKCYNLDESVSSKQFRITLTLKDLYSNFSESISKLVEVVRGKFPKVLKRTQEQIKQGIEFLSEKSNLSFDKIGQFGKDLVHIIKRHSPLNPIGTIQVDFDKIKNELELPTLIADTDLEKKKTILYMEKWPEEIGGSKILYLPLQ